jgi:Zn-dependent protease with chaperone function
MSIHMPDTLTTYQPPPDIYHKAVAYSTAHYTHYFVGAAYTALLLIALVTWRVGPRYRRWTKGRILLYAPAVLLTLAILGLPLDLWDQSLERRFGLSVQSWQSWSSDWITNQILVLLVGTLLVLILYTAIRRSPRRWWLYVWLASLPLLVAAFVIQPLVIDPLFFTFTPLAPTHPALATALQQLVHHGGVTISPTRMFIMNASSKVTTLNAYVTGIGPSKRAVIWDTTIRQAPTSQVLFVFGHEMGHYVLHHIPQEIAFIALGLFVLLYLSARLSVWMLGRWGPRWGIEGLSDLASLPLLLFVISTLGFFATPFFDTMSRHYEHEADRYGLEVTHGIVPNQGQVAAQFFEHSGEIDLADPKPGPFITFWLYDHPTRPQRVHFAATYDPWSHGEKPRYVQ